MLKFKKQAFHIFISTMAFASNWVEALKEKYGTRVEDLLQGTPLQDWGNELGFGIHVVHKAMKPSQAATLMGELERNVKSIAETSVNRHRAVEVKKTGTKRHYQAIQGTTGGCICTAKFGGDAKHHVQRVAKIPALKSFEEWVNEHNVPPMYHVNEVLANIYSRKEDECIGWHDDMHELYETSTDVLSLSVGSPGVFCFQPRKNDKDDRLYKITGGNGCKKDLRRQRTIDKGLRGLVPLFPGDLLVMSGNCQSYMRHKTIQFSRLTDTDKLLERYTATSKKSKQLLPNLSIKLKETSLANRGNFTGRIISHHQKTPVRCPEVPATQQPQQVRCPEVPATLQLRHVPPTIHMNLEVDVNSSDTYGEVPRVDSPLMREPASKRRRVSVEPNSSEPTIKDNLGIDYPVSSGPSNPPREGCEEPTVSPAPQTDVEVPGLMEDVHAHSTAMGGHVSDVDAWMQFRDKMMQELEKIYEATPPEKQPAIRRHIDELLRRSLLVRQSQAIASISLEACDKLTELKTFEGCTCSYLEMPDNQPWHESWTKGMMSKKPARSLRCLMPLGLALEIIRRADRSGAFMVDALIKVDIEKLSGDFQTTTVYWVKDQQLFPSSLAGLFGSRIITKTIECSLDFNKQMRRIQLSPIGHNAQRSGRYMDALCKALLCEKRRQMQIRDAMPRLPWEVKDTWSMPIVLWGHTANR